MLRFACTLAVLILTAAPVLADVTTIDLPRLSFRTDAVTAPTTTTVSAANGR